MYGRKMVTVKPSGALPGASEHNGPIGVDSQNKPPSALHTMHGSRMIPQLGTGIEQSSIDTGKSPMLPV